MNIVSSFGTVQETPQLTLREKDIVDTCNAVIETIRNGLPEEAHTLEACNYVLEKTKEILETKIIMLK